MSRTREQLRRRRLRWLWVGVCLAMLMALTCWAIGKEKAPQAGRPDGASMGQIPMRATSVYHEAGEMARG